MSSAPALDADLRVLNPDVWQPLAAGHAARADALTDGHRARASRGERHAVEDFLYDYYSIRPGHLRRWHPGLEVALAQAPEHAGWTWYASRPNGTVTVDVERFWAVRGSAVRFIGTLLAETAARPAHLSCFGLHEWAMVYRADASRRRHPLPLRLGPDATDAVVESHRVQCTHYDAFRFFTPAAAPLNRDQLTRETQVETEQPGCLHATMDLFKWALKLTPIVPGALVLDAFELALDVRRVDMRASPYDVSSFGMDPIPVETTAGKRQYADLQRGFTERGNALRSLLLSVCHRIEELGAPTADAPRTLEGAH